jgi:hypothetical protein
VNIEKLCRRIEHLEKQHNDLDILIQDEYNRYQDDRLVLHMKKEKLAIKEEIEHLKRQIK